MEQMNRHDGMPTAAKRKRIPYDDEFHDFKERDCYYVDKTRFIESYRGSQYVLLLHSPSPIRQEPYHLYAPELL